MAWQLTFLNKVTFSLTSSLENAECTFGVPPKNNNNKNRFYQKKDDKNFKKKKGLK